MGFIYGIINTVDQVNSNDFKTLEESMLFEGFISSSISEKSFSLGICWNAKRTPNVYIISNSKYVLAADIRLYNEQYLRNFFSFDSPAEAFMKAYELWGEDCANRLNGDFAVVLTDKIKSKTILFRDHIGVRPLVYYTNQGQLIFASHEFGLAKSHLFSFDISPKVIVSKYLHLIDCYTQTPFTQINRLKPGYFASFGDFGVVVSKYWKPEAIRRNKNICIKEAISILREKLITATVSRANEKKIGVHISGGLDSTGIASILADNIGNECLTGYSWSPAEFEPLTLNQVDERPFIEDFISEKHINVNFISGYTTFNKFQENIIPEFEVQNIELPIMKMAQKDSTQIMFSGWGGDEFSSIGLRGTLGHLFFRFKWYSLLKYFNKIGWKSFVHRSLYEVFLITPPFSTVYNFRKVKWKNLKYFRNIWSFGMFKHIISYKYKWVFSIKGRKQLMLNLLEQYHLASRMDSWAINAERYGFEYRYPLLDKEIIEFCFSLPSEFSYNLFENRFLFREALQGILPESIRLRQCKGEALRLTNTLRLRLNGAEHAIEYVENLSDDEEAPFFNHSKFKKMASVCKKEYSKTLSYKPWAFFVFTTYIRYTRLYKEYLINTQKEECESANF